MFGDMMRLLGFQRVGWRVRRNRIELLSQVRQGHEGAVRDYFKSRGAWLEANRVLLRPRQGRQVECSTSYGLRMWRTP